MERIVEPTFSANPTPPAPSPSPPPRSVSQEGIEMERVPRRTGFSPAVPSRKGLRHPGCTGVPPGCPRGCNEDKSPAYLINSQRSPAQPGPFHLSRGPRLFSVPFLRTRIVDRIESEFLSRPDPQRALPVIDSRPFSRLLPKANVTTNNPTFLYHTSFFLAFFLFLLFIEPIHPRT